jgi:antitoxin component YwqK of YwqJK toxin-antitoxin module
MMTPSLLLTLALVAAQTSSSTKSPCPDGTEVKTRKERLGGEAVTRYMCKTPDGQTTGPFVVVYGNGKYAQTGTYDKKGKLDGEFVYFDTSGAKLARTEFVNGVETGERRAYFPSGELQSQGPVTGGQPDGLWSFFHDNGRKQSEGLMKAGKAEGAWTYWDKQGYVLRNGAWRAGVQVGEWAERAAPTEVFARVVYENGKPRKLASSPGDGDALTCKQVSAGWWVLKVSDLGRVVAGWPDGLGQAQITPASRGGEVYGYRVGSIRPGSLVASCGFVDGDVIRAINDVQTTSVSAFATAADRARVRGTAVFHLERDHRIVLVRIEKR